MENNLQFRGLSTTGLICRPWITARNGRKIYAKNYGHKAFCFFSDGRLRRLAKRQNKKQPLAENK